VNPAPIAKPNKKEARQAATRERQNTLSKEWGKGKGKGKGPSRRDANFEHAGVGIAIWKNG
jgi:hypothetical protein